MTADTERTLARLEQELGSAQTLIDTGATLTPHTLAALGRGRGPKQPLFGSLPELSLQLPQDGEESQAPPSTSADLRVMSLLAEGGMGRLFVAEQRSLGREVVIKTVREANNLDQQAALVLEGGIMGTLEHPNIIPVHQLGTDLSGRPMLVMKRIVGVAWSELLDDDQHSGWQRLASGAHRDRTALIVEVLLSVCRALEWAHARGYLHRDIKPDNVMIGESGEVYLADWGIACRLDAGSDGPLVGTPCFLAPEMVTQDYLGERTDVFLLGATLHAALTDTPRHAGREIMQVLRAAMHSEPVAYAADVPGELAALANRATQRDPQQRPASAAAFRQALAEFLAHRGANELCDKAFSSLDELSAVRHQSSLSDVRIARLGAEARFGFEAALQQWPQGERAKQGKARCLELLVHIELDRRNVEAALALVGEMDDPPAALTERLQETVEALAKESAETDVLRHIVKEGDMRVGQRGRALFAMMLLFLAVAVSAGVLFSGRTPEPRHLVIVGLGIGSVCAAVALAMRKRLTENRFGLNLVAIFGGALVLMLVHRLAGFRLNTSVAAIFVGDSLILGVSLLAAAMFGSRRWLFGAASLVCGAVGCALWPAWAVLAFSAGTSVALLAIAVDLLAGPKDGDDTSA